MRRPPDRKLALAAAAALLVAVLGLSLARGVEPKAAGGLVVTSLGRS